MRWFGRLGLVVGLMSCAGACRPAPTASEDPSCGPPCAPDTLRCDPQGEGVLERCVFNLDETGCYGWVTEQDCPAEGAECADAGGATPACVPTGCPATACAPGTSQCASGGVARVCVADEGDPRGCGEFVEQECEAGQVCASGGCRARCERECTMGQRACSPDGELLECVDTSESTGQDCAAFEVVEDCAAVQGGACDADAEECTTNACPRVGARDCGLAGQPRECVEGGGGVLEWRALPGCEANQACIQGECLCDDECAEEGASWCGDGGGAVVECQRVEGCLREVDVVTCAGGDVCVVDPNSGQPACACPPVGAGAPVAGEGCVLNSPEFTCEAPGVTLRCADVDGCPVWRRDDTCPGPSTGYACQSDSIIRVCFERKNSADEVCHYPAVQVCPGTSRCTEVGTGRYDCL